MIGRAEIFTIFFVTLGPLKVLGAFAQRTHGLDDATVRKIAVTAFVIGTASPRADLSAARCSPTGTSRSGR